RQFTWPRTREREGAVNYLPRIDRRSFLVSSAAAAGGLSLGFPLAFDGAASAAESTPENNAWVASRPHQTVVRRNGSSGLGTGTLTGLAQLVAEELECDWSKVTTEFPTPGENLARKRVWGDFFTAGSQGLRMSHELVRKGGAAARMMLIQAAADQWKVPVGECTVDKGVITHKTSGRNITYGKVADAPAKLDPPKDI